MSLQDHIHKNRINHVIQRAEERYDLKLTPKDIESIEFRMFHTSCPLIRPLYRLGRVYLYAVRTKGQWVSFVFDTVNEQVVTVYPKAYLNKYRKILGQVKKQFKEKYANTSDHPLWGEIDRPKIKFPVTPQEVWQDKIS